MPVEDRSRLTSPFGWQEWRGYTHTGHDFGGITPGKSSPVYAAADGVVDLAGGSIPLRTGPQIKINHPDGSATTYGHTRYMKVRRGQTVRRGDRIADTWHTGLKASAGIHLHFEHWTDADDHTTRHDPTKWLAANGWVIRDGRLYDEQPATLNPAASKPTPAKDWFDMATEADLQNAFLNAQITVQRSGKPATITVRQALQNSDSSANAIYGTGLANAGKIAALENTVEQLATGTGVAIDYEKVKAASKAGTQEAIAAGIEVEGTVELKQKEN